MRKILLIISALFLAGCQHQYDRVAELDAVWEKENRELFNKIGVREYTNLTKEQAVNAMLIAFQRLDIVIDSSENQILISTLNNGFYIIKGNKITNFNTENSGIKSNIILSITKISGGDIWLGTYAGATKLSKTPMYTFHREPWINKHSVRSIIEIEPKKLLFGLSEGGIKTPGDYSKYNFLRGYTINDMYKSKNNDFWIGKYRSCNCDTLSLPSR